MLKLSNALKSAAGTVVLAAFVAVGAAALPATSADAQVMLGAYPGAGGESAVVKMEQVLGRKLAIVNRYEHFTQEPSLADADDIAAGRIPMASWSGKKSGGGVATANDILAGTYDAQFAAQAQATAALGGEILIRWSWEMTDASNQEFYGTLPKSQWGPVYIAVWQHIHDIFVANGATNALWVWAPGGRAYIPKVHGGIPCAAFYPGDTYVDVVAVDSYNRSDTPQPFDADPQFLAFYANAPIVAPGKPLMVSETGATSATDAQREWIATAQTSIETEFPKLKAFLYFDHDGKRQKQGKSKLYTLTGAGLAAFQILANDPYFEAYQ